MNGNEEKFSVIVKDDQDCVVSAFNIVGGSFAEIEEECRKKEESTGYTYVIHRDKTLFDVIYTLESRYTRTLAQLVDIRDDLTDIIRGED